MFVLGLKVYERTFFAGIPLLLSTCIPLQRPSSLLH